MSMTRHNIVSVRNKTLFSIKLESEAILLAFVFNDVVLINVKKADYKKEQLIALK